MLPKLVILVARILLNTAFRFLKSPLFNKPEGGHPSGIFANPDLLRVAAGEYSPAFFLQAPVGPDLAVRRNLIGLSKGGERKGFCVF